MSLVISDCLKEWEGYISAVWSCNYRCYKLQ